MRYRILEDTLLIGIRGDRSAAICRVAAIRICFVINVARADFFYTTYTYGS